MIRKKNKEISDKSYSIEELRKNAIDDKLFIKEIGTRKHFYKSELPYNKLLLGMRLALIAERNNGLTPYINENYVCLTCGATSGESHPESSYCFKCDTDNWSLSENANVL
mgnify:CR=1 FL=1